ncbi:uncharacterized protein LAJ45_03082 [Morchella importuna]|uniref:uncharacterized protein n=1 Tax=Morchella importuna TaxID=1174673 RepID=UPI001E8E3495|nr:uncharacterized protein LAJ45_03082 [Morchella importuna]KAH8152856.1 hypothetical protein LAJ45_03082 [Morchella importuna]
MSVRINPFATATPSSAQNSTNRVFSQSGGPTSAYARHLHAANSYLRYYGGQIVVPEKARSERDIIEEHHQFIQENDNESEEMDEEKRLARSYYQKLYREFAVVELARWKEKQIAMRWRTKEEVLAGKGQFLCANLSCRNEESTLDEDPDEDPDVVSNDRKGLRGFELLFEYVEKLEKKSALVKVRVCDQCATKLRYIQEGDQKKSRKSRDKSRGEAKRTGHRSRSKDRGRGRRRRHDYEGTKSGGRTRSRSRNPRQYKDQRRSASPREDEEYKVQHRSRSRKGGDERHKAHHKS